MCGISGIVGKNWNRMQLVAMTASQRHRGPDAEKSYVSANGVVGLGHNRLSIIDLSEAGLQPMCDPTGRYRIIQNGEIYNYLELREELRFDYQFRTESDTEVLIAAYQKWGASCLDKLIGMFALAIWDEVEQSLFIARDRFGVKPVHYHVQPDGTLFFASEIKALHAAGINAEANQSTWATFLTYGVMDHGEDTFWNGIHTLSPGHYLIWKNNQIAITCWYDLATRVSDEFDSRPLATVQEEYLGLLDESIRLRFRADVPVGINLSGGLDSSTLLGLVQQMQGPESEVRAYTFVTGDSNYDELPWVMKMLAKTEHPLTICQVHASEVPALAASVQAHQDEPFGGVPTLCYARLFERAREQGVKVILDGQGMDEQWAGYDYYFAARNGNGSASIVQGTRESPVRPECLDPEFRSLAQTFTPPQVFPDKLRNLQYRDARFTKIPRALRFNDRVSMRSSIELREPFLDHRLFELALRQPMERKLSEGKTKWFLRELTSRLLPKGVVEAPKRPLQTPQREWLRSPLRSWANECIDELFASYKGAWFDKKSVWTTWEDYIAGKSDNSFYVWQWINLALVTKRQEVTPVAA